jgi:hypothetical protein
MKALSIRQPYATAIAWGLKKFETRSFEVNYRGPLAIHASATHIRWQERRQIADIMRYLEAHAPATHLKGGPDYHKLWRQLHLEWMDDDGPGLPRGAIVATVDVVDCFATDDDDFIDSLNPLERALGDYSWDRHAAKLENLKALVEPVPAKGKQGFWDWDGGV